MFKNYLTYTFAQNFHAACLSAGLAPPARERLLRSADTMMRHFVRSLHTTDLKEVSKCLFVTVMCLRDCREILEEAQGYSEDLKARFEVLHGRLERLCEKAADAAEKGQLRMLG